MNKVFLQGNIGKDPEFRQISDSFAVCTFSLATSERYKDKSGETQTKTEWHNVQAINKTAEIISNHCKKGDNITVIGKLVYEQYEKDGEKKTITKVVVNELFFGQKNNTSSGSQHQQGNEYQNNEDDNIPF